MKKIKRIVCLKTRLVTRLAKEKKKRYKATKDNLLAATNEYGSYVVYSWHSDIKLLFLDYHSYILVGMLKKEKKRTADLGVSGRQEGDRVNDGRGVAPDGVRRSTSQPLSDDSGNELSNRISTSRAKVKDRPSSYTTEVWTTLTVVGLLV